MSIGTKNKKPEEEEIEKNILERIGALQHFATDTVPLVRSLFPFMSSRVAQL